MINLMEELEKLMKEKPLPYGRKPVSVYYKNNGEYQQVLIFCSPKSVIWKNLWRDESEMGCYVFENNTWVDYKLEYILGCRKIKVEKIDKLHPAATTDEQWLYSIRTDYNLLLEYGNDVLKGDLEWTKETRYPPNRASPDYEFYVAFGEQKSY